MSKTESPEELFRLPPTGDDNEGLQTIIATLAQFTGWPGPEELDTTTENMGKPASLLNFYCAIRVDLSSIPIGIGPAVYIPLMISEREGGRKSIFFLDQNEETLVGIYVTSDQIALRYMERITCGSMPAQEGDVYTTRIKNREGEVVYEYQEKLEKFNSQTGTGHFETIAPDTGAAASPGPGISTSCWLWSIVTYQPDFFPNWPNG